MLRWGAPSLAASFLPRSRPCSSCRPYFQLFTDAARRTWFTPRRPTMLDRRIRRYALLLLVVAIILGVWGEVSRVLARSSLGKETAEAAVPTVLTIAPNRTELGEELVLPGTVQAYIEAPIYARTSGYLKEWRSDIGTQVTRGQVLGEIETPEVDQQ